MSAGMSRALRLQRLEELLLTSCDGRTSQELASMLDVHRTTVWRDIAELSSQVPVQQVGDRYLIDRRDYLSNVRLNKGESLMLYLALRRMLRRGSKLPPMMARAMEKLSLAIRHPSSVQLAESIQIAQREQPTDVERAKVWEVLLQGWMEWITVRIRYQGYGRTVVEEHEIEPYFFEPALLTEGVYLVGRCRQGTGLRMFEVERILSASLTTRRFERPEDIVVDQMLKHLWGILYGEGMIEVRLRFHDPVLAERVRKTVWLPTQEVRDLADGGVEWSAQVADPFELVPWIRGWGPDCEVLEPPDLSQSITQIEREYGGVTMTTALHTRTASFSQSFYQSLLDMLDGERIRICLQCSSCSGICPHGLAMEYHPRKMIAALRAGVFDAVLESDSIWMCVSCYACTEVCPAKIPVTVGLMTRTKEEMLLSGNVPPELQEALERSQRYGNPLGESPRKRADWAKDFKAEIPIMARANRPVDVLWFVGDYASYHPRVQHSTRAFARILQALGVDFGILGPEEQSDGDSQRMAGERGLFEMLATKNGQAFAKYRFSEIVTTDPHAYNALSNEYPKLGVSYPVRHYTQFLAERLPDLKPQMKQELSATVAFHDPCYLGRVNGVFEEPRQLLRAIPGVELVEMSHYRENSLCCGGGGGGMWLDGFQWEKARVRLSEWRIGEAMRASGADGASLRPPVPAKKRRTKAAQVAREQERDRILAVACPYEAPRFEDAVKMVRGADKLLVKDIAELLADCMGLQRGEP